MAAPPYFSPVAGTYTTGQTVTLNSTTPGASIRYTIDGSTPTAGSGTPYTAGIAVNSTTTVKAIAYKAGLVDSPVVTAAYTIAPLVSAPTFSPGTGIYSAAQTVTISTATVDASIRYTTDGTTPTTVAGTLYTGAFSVSATATVKAIAYAGGMTNSAVTSATFTISPWYNSGWSKRKLITIDRTKVSGTTDLANFPVLISLPIDENLQASAKADGSDILFTAADGVTKLDHEIERYTSATGQLVAWIRVAVLSPNVDTVVQMYYGNASASDQSNKTGVWGAYSMVHHLPNGTALTAFDSTSAGCNASTLNGTTAVIGKMGGGASFNGTSNSIDFGACADLNNWAAQTISVWAKPQSGLDGYARMVEKGSNNEWTLYWSNGKLYFQTFGSSGITVNSGTVIADNNWHKIDATISTSNLLSLYIDGVLKATGQGGVTGTKTANIRLGQYGGGGYRYNGVADELRISNAAQSASWITTEYNNTNSPSSFMSVGAQSGP